VDLIFVTMMAEEVVILAQKVMEYNIYASYYIIQVYVHVLVTCNVVWTRTSLYVHVCVCVCLSLSISLRVGTVAQKHVATYVETCNDKYLQDMIYVTTKHYFKFVINLHWPIWYCITWTAKKSPLNRTKNKQIWNLTNKNI